MRSQGRTNCRQIRRAKTKVPRGGANPCGIRGGGRAYKLLGRTRHKAS